jgi:outer membrane receptor protein involved in Fe transport
MVATILTVMATPARAQEPREVTVEASSYELEEVIVTAQRRDQSLQDVPISVTALSGEDLQLRGATTAEDLQAIVPGFIFTQNLNSVNVVLRGVATNDNSAANEGSVGLYVDADGLFTQPEFDLVNIRATWTDANVRWSLSLWAKNLFDEQYFLRVGNSGLGAYEARHRPGRTVQASATDSNRIDHQEGRACHRTQLS